MNEGKQEDVGQKAGKKRRRILDRILRFDKDDYELVNNSLKKENADVERRRQASRGG